MTGNPNDKLRDPDSDELMRAVLSLKSIDECYAFFEDICTVNELQSISQRYAVARMLIEGSIYADIVAETGASTATISRVSRSLNYGNDGYKLVLKRRKL